MANAEKILGILPFTGSVVIGLAILFRAYDRIKLLLNKKRLINKVVLITGAGSGIGEEIAHKFYSEGCKVILASRNIENLNRVKDEILQCYQLPTVPEPVVIKLDLSDNSSHAKFVESAIGIYGHVDVLINNAGMSCRCRIMDTDMDVHFKLMQVNYFGQIGITKLFAEHMVKRQSGHIVFMNSIQGLVALPSRSPYGSSKHALYAYADTLRSELHRFNVNVTSIFPRIVKTYIAINALKGNGETYGKISTPRPMGLSTKVVAEETFNAVVCNKCDVVLVNHKEMFYIRTRSLLKSLYYMMISHLERESPEVKQSKHD